MRREHPRRCPARRRRPTWAGGPGMPGSSCCPVGRASRALIPTARRAGTTSWGLAGIRHALRLGVAPRGLARGVVAVLAVGAGGVDATGTLREGATGFGRAVVPSAQFLKPRLIAKVRRVCLSGPPMGHLPPSGKVCQARDVSPSHLRARTVVPSCKLPATAIVARGVERLTAYGTGDQGHRVAPRCPSVTPAGAGRAAIVLGRTT